MSSEPFTFTDLTYLLLFLLAVWVAGRLSKFVGCPSIVGEVLIGSLLGPPLANFAPFPNALALLGEVGLVLLIVVRPGPSWFPLPTFLSPGFDGVPSSQEGGLETDLALLKAVGAKGVLIAFCGSVFGPFLIGIGFATALGSPVREALAVGAALSPTSLACALSILKAERVLNTPVGQSILAAAVVDDVIALVLLSELAALNAPSASSFAVPIAAAIGFVLGVGAAAVHVVPVLLSKLVPFIPPAHVEDSVVMLVRIHARKGGCFCMLSLQTLSLTNPPSLPSPPSGSWPPSTRARRPTCWALFLPACPSAPSTQCTPSGAAS